MIFCSKEPFKVHLVYPLVILIIILFVTPSCNQYQDLLMTVQTCPNKNFIYIHAALQSQAAKRSNQVKNF